MMINNFRFIYLHFIWRGMSPFWRARKYNFILKVHAKFPPDKERMRFTVGLWGRLNNRLIVKTQTFFSREWESWQIVWNKN